MSIINDFINNVKGIGSTVVGTIGKGITNKLNNNTPTQPTGAINPIGAEEESNKFNPFMPGAVKNFMEERKAEREAKTNDFIDTIKNAKAQKEAEKEAKIKTFVEELKEKAQARAEEKALEEERAEKGEDKYTDMTEANQKEQWAREDAIRQAVWNREDSAYSRAVADMRKAGINPNLLGVTPSASGGGITQATGKESILSSKINSEIDMIMQQIDKEFDMDQNQRDRIQRYIESALKTAQSITLSSLFMLK